MRIATWNVNSVKAHLEQVLAYLREARPDVVCLQEIKCEDHAFPSLAFSELGYQAAVHGQKTWHGVALLSRLPMEDVTPRLPGDASDEQARFIAATVLDGPLAVRVASLYLPNGNPAPGPKYDYKLGWMERLTGLARDWLAGEEAFVLAGDFNVIPAPEDARNPAQWAEDALFLPRTRNAFRALLGLGLTDAWRTLHPDVRDGFTFWDYQAGAWQRDNGIRIDHHLLSPQAADRLKAAEIARDQRGKDRPSDHVPVTITLA
ncbi:MAG TPA: exodeoxyribonuclease III [Aestuariivirga sp.]|jgi:exodeoxyribonuclease-3|nr:exodeoxyribonuclease III [Aestuariivirga sp.]